MQTRAGDAAATSSPRLPIRRSRVESTSVLEKKIEIPEMPQEDIVIVPIATVVTEQKSVKDLW